MTKIYKRRKLYGLVSQPPHFAGFDYGQSLADMLNSAISTRIYLCGPLEKMTREWMRPPLGWGFCDDFVFKSRAATYRGCAKCARNEDHEGHGVKEVFVKLVSHRESWLPGCEDVNAAIAAWRALESEWKSTGLPLLSSPAATGKALLWETLPCDKDGNAVEFPALPDDLAKLIRANSPQHRIEWLLGFDSDLARERRVDSLAKCIPYDGRWMYAAMCGLDRFPIGAPRRADGCRHYEPGWHKVVMRVPHDWNHVGLIPVKEHGLHGGFTWGYPNVPGEIFETWVCEPELTLARQRGWEILNHLDGYTFDKGRPLAGWSVKLIEMRERLQDAAKAWFYSDEDKTGELNHFDYAAAAVRQILNHTIGAIHRNDYERETFVSDDNFRQWRREHPDLAEGEGRGYERVEGGYIVPCFVPDNSPLGIFMPHWSSTLYSLARARVAEWALRCDPATLVKIHGDAIYSTVEQSELDKLDDGETLGRPRRK